MKQTDNEKEHNNAENINCTGNGNSADKFYITLAGRKLTFHSSKAFKEKDVTCTITTNENVHQ